MHTALTVITRIIPEEAEALTALLDRIGQDIRGVRDNDVIRLEDIRTLHFGRWVVIHHHSTGEGQWLLFTTNFDGPLYAHLDEFIDKAGPALDEIFGRCEGYPTNRASDPAGFRQAFYRYIEDNSVDWQAFYIGVHNDSVRDVHRYKEIHTALQDFADDPQARGLIKTRLRPLIERLPGPEIDLPNPVAPLLRTLTEVVKIVLFVTELLIGAFDIVVLTPLRQTAGRPNRRDLREQRVLDLDLSNQSIQPGVEALEDQVTQNQLTVISSIRPGFLPLIRLKLALMLIHTFARRFHNQGSLGGITTIHFARWCILDNGRYLLFESNYDGSWDSYIGDFSDKVAWGLDLIWTSHPDYPRGGAADIEPFKDIIRRNQVRTQVFYSAYPDLTVFNRLNDRAIARTLRRDRVEALLRRL